MSSFMAGLFGGGSSSTPPPPPKKPDPPVNNNKNNKNNKTKNNNNNNNNKNNNGGETMSKSKKKRLRQQRAKAEKAAKAAAELEKQKQKEAEEAAKEMEEEESEEEEASEEEEEEEEVSEEEEEEVVVEVKKSKKKKNKKKSQAASEDVSEDDEVTEEVVGTANALNPHEQLRLEVMSRNKCTASEFEQAVEQMWNLGLPYDEVDSVVAFLAQKKSAVAAVVHKETTTAVKSAPKVVPSNTKDKPAVVTPAAVQDAVKPPSPVASTTESKPTSTSPAGTPPAAKTSPSTTETTSKKRPSPVPTYTPPPTQIPLPTKLTMVASYRNVHDAAYALTEWATKVAQPAELTTLCNPRTKAVPILIQRSLVECKDAMEFANLIPTLMGLFSVVLSHQRKEVHSVGPVQMEPIRAVLLAAWETVYACPDASTAAAASTGMDGGEEKSAKDGPPTITPSQITQVVSQTLMNLMSLTPSSSPTNATTSTTPLPTSTRGGGGSEGGIDVAALLSQRDRKKAMAERAGLNSLRSNNTSSSAAKAGTSSAISGLDGDLTLTQTFQQNTARTTTLRTLLGGGRERFHRDRDATQAELRSCQLKKAEIHQRKEELKQLLKNIEAEEAGLMEREGVLRKKLDGAQGSFQKEQERMREELEERNQLAKVGEAYRKVECAVDRVKAVLLGGSEDGSAAGGSGVEDGGRVGGAGGEKEEVEKFVKIMEGYFSTEADCVQFLKQRANSSRVRMQALKQEIATCRNLGMATNVSQMSLTLNELSKYVTQDDAAVSSLQKSAQQMTRTLTSRLHEATSKSGTSGSSAAAASLAHVASNLKEIASALTRMGLSADGLLPFMSPEDRVLGMGMTTTGTSGTGASNVGVVGGPSGRGGPLGLIASTTPPATAAAAVMAGAGGGGGGTSAAGGFGAPLSAAAVASGGGGAAVLASSTKMGWGAAPAIAGGTAGGSLLDIQKEELSGRK